MTILRAYALRLLFFVGLGCSAANAGESAAALIQAGINEVCAKFAEIVSAAEGTFTEINQFGCLGAFQFCPGTFELYYSGTADQFLHDPHGQVAAWTKFEQNQWKLAEKNTLTTRLTKEVVSFNGMTAKIDDSAILMACQFGCAKGGKLANYAADQGRNCNAAAVKDGNGESVCAYLIKGAGQNVSCFTEGVPVNPNGACGSSNGASLTSAPTANLCSAGMASSVSGSGPWAWSCAGSNGGTTASCSANPITNPNGACGSSNGASLTSAPTANLCSAGMASSVSGSGPWAWSCAGSNGGATASCNANPITNPGPAACGPEQFGAEGPLEIVVGQFIFRFSSAASTDTVKKYLDIIDQRK